ncbi:hypothetical protein JQX13_00685 [Archangium violaceum]|uniref:hypothetical protein n=1 Tax=Archangium violaceum TaxID=83451 RepID=UPI00193C3FC2|nr:hypothetical protein [Archangium violaceum]QRK08738.1 hypothetical protein JQX13_00685 [Archangium violaceum]
MKSLVPVVLCFSCFLTGCSLLSHFGYYKRPTAERAPSEEAEQVRFPDSFEPGVHLNGQHMGALRVAMDDFLPPGSKVKGDNERIAECLSRWSTYDTSVLRANDDLYFVSFLPRLSRCGLDAIVLDAGATYAIDGRGRILDVR